MANDPCFEVFPQMRDVDLAEYERWEAAEGENPKPTPEPTGEFCWRYRNADGKITATSAGGFPSRQDAHDALEEMVYALFRLVLGQRIGLSLPVPVVDLDE